MIKYQLNQTVRRPRGAEVLLPVTYGRLGSQEQYRKTLRKLLLGLSAEVRRSVLPALAAHRRSQNDALVHDDESWFFLLRSFAKSLQQIAKELVDRILRLESERHTSEFHKSAKKALGVDLKAIVRKEDLEGYLRDANARNASLIKSLSDDTIKQVEQLVLQAKLNGTSQRELKALLQKRFKVAENRANLIAADQLNKLNSDLNKIRQQQAGVTEYVWSTSADERVRPLHNRLNGKKYKWGKPTGAEQGLPPGQPVRCRCSARGVVKF